MTRACGLCLFWYSGLSRTPHPNIVDPPEQIQLEYGVNNGLISDYYRILSGLVVRSTSASVSLRSQLPNAARMATADPSLAYSHFFDLRKINQ